MTALQRLATIAALALLAGCAGLREPAVPVADWQAQRDTLNAIRYFTASGKVALRTAEQAENATLLWQQLGESSHLRLSGPMGFSATTVDSNGRQVVVRQGDETQRWDIDDPALQYAPGLHLPLRALQHWLKGVPAPELEIEALQLDAAGRLPQRLQQQGWQVEYQEFAEFEGFTLPTRLRIHREDTSARIILSRWQDISAS